ncbi:uncharacterized protein [Henckelia pumila]|uniref:uncharacterized protein isoform X2 n=1 Tax=Henckelia pumila TaxID=405737 RepID=UPI003C6DCE33
MEVWPPLPRCSIPITHNSSVSISIRYSLSVRILNASVFAGPSTVTATVVKRSKERISRDKSDEASASKRKTGPSNPVSNAKKLNLEVSPHRAVSAVRLMRIELGGAFADLLNEKGKGSGDNEMGYVERTLGFRTRDLEDRDLRLVTEIVGGTIRWRRYLDYLILSMCHDDNTFRSMEPLLLQILRIGFYEIVKLEMPHYAVVDENVKVAKFALRPGAGNMVNAVLRKLVLLKESNSLPLPRVDGDDRQQARALATIHSHPVVPYEISHHLDDFVRIRAGLQAVLQAGLLNKGFCSVQDESAGLVVAVVDPQPGENIIDCCAAPGGKTLFMASHLKGQGSICAIDVNKGRLRILKETAKLHEVINVVTTIHADLREFADSNSLKFDKVLLDAPCSGLGVLSKRADLRWNRRLEDMDQLKTLQDELLDSASTLVKPAGVLVYSTCSIDQEENEERVAAFLLRHPEFYVDQVHKYIPSSFVTEDGFYRSNPVKHSLDGAFAARLLRSG